MRLPNQRESKRQISLDMKSRGRWKNYIILDWETAIWCSDWTELIQLTAKRTRTDTPIAAVQLSQFSNPELFTRRISPPSLTVFGLRDNKLKHCYKQETVTGCMQISGFKNPKHIENLASATSWRHHCLWISTTKGCPCVPVTDTCSSSDRTSVLARLWELPRQSMATDARFHIRSTQILMWYKSTVWLFQEEDYWQGTHFWTPRVPKLLVTFLSNFKVCLIPP